MPDNHDDDLYRNIMPVLFGLATRALFDAIKWALEKAFKKKHGE